jgi:hypothetical protein
MPNRTGPRPGSNNRSSKKRRMRRQGPRPRALIAGIVATVALGLLSGFAVAADNGVGPPPPGCERVNGGTGTVTVGGVEISFTEISPGVVTFHADAPFTGTIVLKAGSEASGGGETTFTISNPTTTGTLTSPFTNSGNGTRLGLSHIDVCITAATTTSTVTIDTHSTVTDTTTTSVPNTSTVTSTVTTNPTTTSTGPPKTSTVTAQPTDLTTTTVTDEVTGPETTVTECVPETVALAQVTVTDTVTHTTTDHVTSTSTITEPPETSTVTTTGSTSTVTIPGSTSTITVTGEPLTSTVTDTSTSTVPGGTTTSSVCTTTGVLPTSTTVKKTSSSVAGKTDPGNGPSAGAAHEASGSLPFTGMHAPLLALIGLGMALTGLTLRRQLRDSD